VSRTVYLGTSDFAATVLRRLADSPHRPGLVVTPPDRRKGRGRRSLPPPAAEAATELGLELLQTPNVNDPAALERIRAAGPDVAAVCAFGQLIREPLLSELLMLNVHPSLLPRWRGAAPIERAIMAGDDETGVSVMRVTAGLDSGPVALFVRVPIDPGDDYGTLAGRLAELGGELLVRALDLRAAGALELVDQSEEDATYAEKIDSSDRRLDPAEPAVDLARRVRALTPHVGAFVELDGGGRLGVRAARAQADAEGLSAGEFAARDGRLLLGCSPGAVRLDVVQPPGGRPMPADAYLRGHSPPARASVS
jgi:methionyl-tRNA formyltransferase